MAAAKTFEFDATRPKKERIFLFDVDGTLTVARKPIVDDMRAFMADVRKKAYVGVVGGSDYSKQLEQLGENVAFEWDYLFSENGLVSWKHGVPMPSQSMAKMLGEEKLQKLINFILGYFAKIELPCKRGTFVEFRTGMLNVSPIGRQCSQEERDAFEKYDESANVRKTMVKALQEQFPDYGLKYSIGGQISFDIFPIGWDKTYCLQFLEQDGYKEIHFFGDKTYEGGNDYEIYESVKTIGHTVKSWEDTKRIMTEILAKD